MKVAEGNGPCFCAGQQLIQIAIRLAQFAKGLLLGLFGGLDDSH